LYNFKALHYNPVNVRVYLAHFNLTRMSVYYQVVLPPLNMIRVKSNSVFMRSGEFLLTGSQINQLFRTERDLSMQIGFPSMNNYYAVIYGSDIENACYEDTYSLPIMH